MAIKLTEKQMKVVKELMEYSQAFANQVLNIMRNHELDKLNGCNLSITVNPEWYYATRTISMGHDAHCEFGRIEMTRGMANAKYSPMGTNSAEYELLFADEEMRSRMEKVLQPERPLPPDGLWVGDPRNDSPVDGWEWDVNDSLS